MNCPLSFHVETIFSVSKEKPLTGRTIVSSELEVVNGHHHGLGAVTSKDKGIYWGSSCDRRQERRTLLHTTVQLSCAEGGQSMGPNITPWMSICCLRSSYIPGAIGFCRHRQSSHCPIFKCLFLGSDSPMTTPCDHTNKPDTDASCNSTLSHAWHSVRAVTSTGPFHTFQDECIERLLRAFCLKDHLLSLCITLPFVIPQPEWWLRLGCSVRKTQGSASFWSRYMRGSPHLISLSI